MQQGISPDNVTKGKLSGAKRQKAHSCPWPFPKKPLLYHPANPPPLNGSNQNPSGQKTRSKQATHTYEDMTTELGDALI